MKKLALLLLLLCSPLFATTYYISYSTGSNGNNGLSEAAPWKTHPYMQTTSTCTGTGSAPVYIHADGDIFIFKQGDSWPNTCFDMVLNGGGVAGAPDTYTFDPNWGTAGGTRGNANQVVGAYQFTAGNAVIDGSDGYNRFIIDDGFNYVTFNGMELTGITWTGAGGSYGNGIAISIAASEYVIVSNCYMHGWTHPDATSDVFIGVQGEGEDPYNLGSEVTSCVFDGINSGGTGVSDSGSAVFDVPLVDNNIIRNMSNGVLSNLNATIHDNLIGPINQDFDDSEHENCIETITMDAGVASTNYIYNNVTHDCTAVNILTQGAAANTGTEIDYIWNNVAYVGTADSPPIPIEFDSISTTNSGSAIYAWNNTVDGGAGLCFRSIDRGNGNYGILQLINNHCITSGGSIYSFPITGNSQTINNNILSSTTDGFSTPTSSGVPTPYAYAPISASAATIGAGENLNSSATGFLSSLANDTGFAGYRTVVSRGGGSCTPAAGVVGCWDAGAFQYTTLVPSVISISNGVVLKGGLTIR
ncbi:Uncharacterised protein [uncultured archaeon]|nr:Uncharacterised protein [uncultured archaeon]